MSQQAWLATNVARRFNPTGGIDRGKCMALGHRLKQERQAQGLTQDQLAVKAGMDADSGRKTIQVLEARDSERSTYAGALARALGVRLEWLVDGDGPVRPDEDAPRASSGTTRESGRQEFDAHHKKNDVRQDSAESSTTKLVQTDPLKAPIEGAIAIRMQRVPVVGTAQFGDEGYWEETQYPVGHGDGYVHWPSKDQNAYALRGVGTSMEPRIRHGEFVICEPNRPTSPGDDVMVRCLNGRTMAKRYSYKRDGMIYLDSINKDHPQIAIPEDQIEKMHFIAGVANSALWEPAS